ncbi:hypothetical protein T552_02480 [Pneumocystis carinii B80]|uniref:Ribosomal protein L10 n=1 Tax=Pneumocystis carinii (strain B80) TaxID=1408658 RepID=A0A0W4ZF37_PNEC8|nr:hypothetical protein T552_02480 [Pneumocystis carinii B80]KTW26989.1 hypothetical protein T552_02480 [Pneumocystis carinii B80]
MIYPQINSFKNDQYISNRSDLLMKYRPILSFRGFSSKRITPREKKAFIQAIYHELIQLHPTFLLIQQNNVSSEAWKYMRRKLHGLGANIKVLKIRLFGRALQAVSEDLEGKSSNKDDSLQSKIQDLRALRKMIAGPIAIITFSARVEPSFLKRVIYLIDTSNGQFFLLGGFFEGKLVNTKELLHIKEIPDLSVLHMQLIYSLMHHSNQLIQTLEYSSEALTLILLKNNYKHIE